MTRTGAIALFAVLHVAANLAVCLINTSYIIRDAVVGPELVAAFHAVLLLPVFVVGVIILAAVSFTEIWRLRLALGFPAITAVVVETLVLSAQLGWYETGGEQSAIPVLAGLNVVISVGYLSPAVIGRWRVRLQRHAA